MSKAFEVWISFLKPGKKYAFWYTTKEFANIEAIEEGLKEYMWLRNDKWNSTVSC